MIETDTAASNIQFKPEASRPLRENESISHYACDNIAGQAAPRKDQATATAGGSDVENSANAGKLRRNVPGGGSSPIFVYGCAILRFETPPLSKVPHRQKFDPFVRQIWEKVTGKCLKTYDSVHLRKFFNLILVKYAFFRVKP